MSIQSSAMKGLGTALQLQKQIWIRFLTVPFYDMFQFFLIYEKAANYMYP